MLAYILGTGVVIIQVISVVLWMRTLSRAFILLLGTNYWRVSGLCIGVIMDVWLTLVWAIRVVTSRRTSVNIAAMVAISLHALTTAMALVIWCRGLRKKKQHKQGFTSTTSTMPKNKNKNTSSTDDNTHEEKEEEDEEEEEKQKSSSHIRVCFEHALSVDTPMLQWIYKEKDSTEESNSIGFRSTVWRTFKWGIGVIIVSPFYLCLLIFL